MRFELHPFSLSLAGSLVTAAGRIDARHGFVIRVHDGDDLGVGEATPLHGWTEATDECRRSLRAAVDGPDGDGPDAVLAALEDAPAARHGVSLALADLHARRRGIALYRHLGADERIDFVPANATVGDGPVSKTAADARSAVEAGFDCLKVKVGVRSIDEDVNRLDAVRGAVGPDVALRADANGGWCRRAAAAAVDAFHAADLDLDYVEQPLPADDLDALAGLSQGPIDVAVDESLVGTAPETVIDAAAADVLILKPMVLGGLDRARAVSHHAAERGVRSVVSTTIDGVVARTGAIHLAASLPDPAPAGVATAAWLTADLGADPAPIVDGHARVPSSPGHGVSLEEQSQ